MKLKYKTWNKTYRVHSKMFKGIVAEKNVQICITLMRIYTTKLPFNFIRFWQFSYFLSIIMLNSEKATGIDTTNTRSSKSFFYQNGITRQMSKLKSSLVKRPLVIGSKFYFIIKFILAPKFKT